ncbi:MAG: glycogen/starch synthase [Flavobacteriales bacterium]|nr:glycogen/starch synthase [Flavobacteriales bacterium]MCB9336216.1 glycogen/starch synthase [Flavobacteriales bacterium]
MKKKKILFISQEITPYLEENELSTIGRNLPQGIQEAGKEIRTFMPKFGCINERRNQLHEVIRLSGMNLIINENDHPLIIKVGSLQPARMQVYFIDSEDFFQRKAVFHDKESGEFFEDNDERAIFFARGVLETVKKLGWVPDVIHCHGWMTSLVPLYIKTSYSKDPIFQNSKVVYSLYDNDFNKALNSDFGKKAIMDGMSENDIADYKKTSFVDINIAAMNASDAIVKTSKKIHPKLQEYFDNSEKPKLECEGQDCYINAHSDFYDEILESVEVLQS